MHGKIANFCTRRAVFQIPSARHFLKQLEETSSYILKFPFLEMLVNDDGWLNEGKIFKNCFDAMIINFVLICLWLNVFKYVYITNVPLFTRMVQDSNVCFVICFI